MIDQSYKDKQGHNGFLSKDTAINSSHQKYFFKSIYLPETFQWLIDNYSMSENHLDIQSRK